MAIKDKINRWWENKVAGWIGRWIMQHPDVSGIMEKNAVQYMDTKVLLREVHKRGYSYGQSKNRNWSKKDDETTE